jgi:hypothetical protein
MIHHLTKGKFAAAKIAGWIPAAIDGIIHVKDDRLVFTVSEILLLFLAINTVSSVQI